MSTNERHTIQLCSSVKAWNGFHRHHVLHCICLLNGCQRSSFFHISANARFSDNCAPVRLSQEGASGLPCLSNSSVLLPLTTYPTSLLIVVEDNDKYPNCHPNLRLIPDSLARKKSTLRDVWLLAVFGCSLRQRRPSSHIPLRLGRPEVCPGDCKWSSS